ncbi:MAG: energy-coupling factor transporter transmembrane component T [Baekduia sp.]
MRYLRLDTPLHAARATIGLSWCAALMVCALLAGNPATLAIVGLAGLAAARFAGVFPQVLRAAVFMLPWAIVFALINGLVARQGLTVIARLGDFGPLGQVDVTLEALVYGAEFGLRLVVLVLPSALLALAVDPDQLLRAAGRRSLRGALGATMATRLVPTLAADARRLDEARRCRPVPPRGGRVAVLRAVTAGALDRALDVAATLEVRGFSSTTARRRRAPVPWSRQDLAFAVSVVLLLVVAVWVRAAGIATFETYPEISGSLVSGIVPGLVIAACALAPFAVRRGIVR